MGDRTVKTKYTPGPWRVRKLFSGKFAISIKDKNHFVSNSYGNEEANATLIAAAPDLLEALELILEACQKEDGADYRQGPDVNWLEDTVRDAISRAKGENNEKSLCGIVGV